MKLKIILLHALVGSVLLYSLHLFPLTQTQIKRTQTFYSKCIRFLTQEPYTNLTQKPVTDKQIRNTYNIPSIESKLKVFRYIMFASWENTLSFAYLNNKQYIRTQLNQLNQDIREIKEKSLNFKTITETPHNSINITHFIIIPTIK